MKKALIVYLVFFTLTGCVTMSGGDGKGGYDQSPEYVVRPGEVVNGLEKRYISPSLRKKLGLGERSILVGLEEGKRVIFISDGLQRINTSKNAFPKGRRLISEIQLIQTSNSPPCISYRDSGGDEGWWPLDCPRD